MTEVSRQTLNVNKIGKVMKVLKLNIIKLT